MEIINPNSLPGGNARSCGSEALLPPHNPGDGCGNYYPPCTMHNPCSLLDD